MKRKRKQNSGALCKSCASVYRPYVTAIAFENNIKSSGKLSRFSSPMNTSSFEKRKIDFFFHVRLEAV